ncbi:MAG: serine/threonine protein kinase [Muribaculaceae bacterium]|nr:serine/threonine protein kinase [Muribaculaceae bacterium]
MAILIIQGTEEKALGIHYEVDTSLPPIGAGGMGQVMRGVRVQNNVRRAAAVKFLFDDLPESAIERSRREASVKISNENLVEMFGFIEMDTVDASGNVHKRYHVASELLNGVMLHDLLRGKTTDASGEEIPFAKELYRQYSCDRMRFAVYIIRNVLSGIMALHDAGYIHRDIDPSNIMITSDGKVKVIDFGICRRIGEGVDADRHLTSAGQFMGKAAYAAPELVTGDIAHQAETTDLYAIGIMFYELITGKVPFDGATHEVLAKQMKENVPVKNLADKYARKVIEKATAKKQDERYASAAEFRVAVEQLSRHSVSAGKTASPQKAVKSDSKEHKLGKKTLIVAAAAMAVLVIGIVIGLRDGSDDEAEKLAQQERERMIEARKAELADMIIDDLSLEAQTDSLTGQSIPTAGLLIDKARKQLSSVSTASEGVATLRRVADRGMKSSAEALAVLASLNLRSQTLDPAILAATDSLFVKDFAKAHELNNAALALDSANYHALYELALDYMAGDARGVVDRDIAKASAMLEHARANAELAGDKAFVARIDEPLRQLKPELYP